MSMFTREASALDLFTDSVRLLGDATLCAVMEFDRRLDPARLEDVARACLMAHPILRSRLVRGHGPAFWEMMEDARTIPVVVEECGVNYHPRVVWPMDPYGSPQFRVRLLRRPYGDVVVINLAHAAADGSGLHVLMAQLLQEYVEPGSIPPAEGGIPVRDTHWTRALVSPPPPDITDVRTIDPLWPDPFGTSSAPSSYHRDVIGPDPLDSVRAHAKTLGGNLNDALMAAYFLAMSDLTGHCGPIDLFFPVNLRRHLKDGSRVMSNQSANVSIPMERAAGEGMKEILPRVIARTRILKENGFGLAEQVLMDRSCDPGGIQVHRMAERMVALQEEGLADIFISNPGPITLPAIPGLTDAYLCYPGCTMPATCFVISTFRAQMTITMGFQDSDRAREGTQKAMDLFRYHLLQATGAAAGQEVGDSIR